MYNMGRDFNIYFYFLIYICNSMYKKKDQSWKKLSVTAILDKSSKLAKKKGVSLKEMLAELDKIRHDS